MKRFPINKKVTLIPYFLGFPLKMGYAFISICFLLVLLLLFTGFTLKKLAVLAVLVAVVYVSFIFLSSRRKVSIEKRWLARQVKIDAIKNNSLAPFKNGSNDK